MKLEGGPGWIARQEAMSHTEWARHVAARRTCEHEWRVTARSGSMALRCHKCGLRKLEGMR